MVFTPFSCIGEYIISGFEKLFKLYCGRNLDLVNVFFKRVFYLYFTISDCSQKRRTNLSETMKFYFTSHIMSSYRNSGVLDINFKSRV